MLRQTSVTMACLLVIAACGTAEDGNVIDDFAPTEGDAAPLEVELGSGVESFQRVDDGEPLAIVGGPQGGTHVWGAVRVNGVSDERVRIAFELRMTDMGELDGELGPLRVLLEPSDVEGFWEASGMTVFLDDPNDVNGTECDLTVIVTDADGRQATDVRRVMPRWE